MALLFAQETRRAAPLEKVNQYTRLVCFVLQCLQAVREPSLEPSRVCIQANNRLNSAWISLTCPHIVATSPRQTVGPHVPPPSYRARSLALSSTLVIDVLRGYFLRLSRALATDDRSTFTLREWTTFPLFQPCVGSRANRSTGFREFISHTWRLIRGQKTRREEKRERGGWNFNINICKGPCCCSRYVDAWPNNCGWNGTKIFGTFKRDCWNVCLSCIGERMKIQMLSIVCLKILLLMRLFKFNRYFFFLF